jgi:phosphohistidine phosphatase
MRRLMLVRHAKAMPPEGLADEARPLAKRGRKAVAAIGAFMAANGLTPDLALVSPSRRTLETWDLLLPALVKSPACRPEPRLYAAPPETLLQVVRAMPADVSTLLLIGHNPGLEQFALALIGSGAAEAMARFGGKMPTASLAVIELALDDWRRVEPKSGRLELFVTPKSLGAAADADD